MTKGDAVATFPLDGTEKKLHDVENPRLQTALIALHNYRNLMTEMVITFASHTLIAVTDSSMLFL